jgi:uncharacterized membrane protein
VETAAGPTPALRRSVVLSTALVAIGFAVGAVVLASSAGWYLVFKTLHVFFAFVWIGGGLLMTLLGVKAELSKDPEERVWIARQGAFVSGRIFAPSSLVVLAAGIAMMVDVDWGWEHFWVLFGLAGFAWTFTTGLGVIVPLTHKLDRLVDTVGPSAPESQAVLSRILLAAKIDIAVLMLVVIDMIVKPFS